MPCLVLFVAWHGDGRRASASMQLCALGPKYWKMMIGADRGRGSNTLRACEQLVIMDLRTRDIAAIETERSHDDGEFDRHQE